MPQVGGRSVVKALERTIAAQEQVRQAAWDAAAEVHAERESELEPIQGPEPESGLESTGAEQDASTPSAGPG